VANAKSSLIIQCLSPPKMSSYTAGPQPYLSRCVVRLCVSCLPTYYRFSHHSAELAMPAAICYDHTLATRRPSIQTGGNPVSSPGSRAEHESCVRGCEATRWARYSRRHGTTSFLCLSQPDFSEFSRKTETALSCEM
jgi:hypothetical protein